MILIGAGGHCKVVYDCLKELGYDHADITLCDSSISKINKPFMSNHIIHSFEQTLLKKKLCHVCIGDNSIRESCFNQAQNANADIQTIVHRLACVSQFSRVEKGCFLAAYCIVATSATIGKGTIINHHAVVDHDSQIESFSHIAPNATLGGGVIIGNNVLVGSGAIILPQIKICSNAIIGSGSVVTRNIEVEGIYVGQPAKLLSERMQ